MRKLKLDLEEIHVESFPASAAADGEGGTVEAHAKTNLPITCQAATCQQTCDGTSCAHSYCIDSCWETCHITCGECFSVVICN